MPFASRSGGGGGKPTDDSWGLDELWADIKSLRGIPAGLWATGSAVAHDAGKLFGVSTGSYQTDDIAKAIADSYKYTYGPAFHGQLGTTWQRMGEHPLYSMLDASTVFTGGASLAAKGGVLAAKHASTASRLGRAGASIAGLERSAHLSHLPAMREVVGPGGVVFGAKTRALRNSQGEVTYRMPLHQNPAIRMRQQAREAVFDKLPAGTPRFGRDVRGTRHVERVEARIARRSRDKLAGAAERALSGLSKEERFALFHHAQGVTSDARVEALRAARRAHLETLVKKRQVDREPNELQIDAPPGTPRVRGESPDSHDETMIAAHIAADEKMLAATRDLMVRPTEKMRDALDAVEAVQDYTNSMLRDRLVRSGYSPEDAQRVIELRQKLPLRSIGIEPDEGERLVTITHNVTRAGKKTGRVDGNSSVGLVDPRNPELMMNEAKNWLSARMVSDPALVVRSMKRMGAGDDIARRVQRALDSGIPFDKELHARAIEPGGPLVLITPSSKGVRDLREIVEFVDGKLVEVAGELTDPEHRALIGALQQLVDDVHAEGVVIPRAQYDFLSKQTRGAVGLIGRLNRAAIDQWRHIVLSLKGTFYVNNFLGNLLIGLLEHPLMFTKNLLRESPLLRDKTSRRIEADVPDAQRTGATHVLTKEQSRAARMDLLGKLGHAVARQGAKLTDDNFRRAAFRGHLDRMVRRARKNIEAATGSKPSRGDVVELLMNDKRVVDGLAEAMFGDMLDYSRLTPFERDYMVALLPFWAFTRSMAGRTIRLSMDEPWKMRVLFLFGAYGIEASEEKFGADLPDFLSGVIIGGEESPGRFRAATTYGSNPFTAPVDAAGQVLSLLGQEDSSGGTNPVASMNPFLKSGLEAAFKKDTFYGQDLSHLSRGEILRRQLLGNLPPVQLYRKGWSEPALRPMLERSRGELVAGYMGFPVGTLNRANVRRGMAIEAKERQRLARYKQRLEARRG